MEAKAKGILIFLKYKNQLINNGNIQWSKDLIVIQPKKGMEKEHRNKRDAVSIQTKLHLRTNFEDTSEFSPCCFKMAILFYSLLMPNLVLNC